MIRFIFIFLSLLFFSCSSRKPASFPETSLLTLDLTQDIPSRRVNIHDIADVEYIPLETNDRSLLTETCSDFYISDNYIITSDLNGGDNFFFNRSGKHLWTMNRRGNGGEEYAINNMIVDFETEECFVQDYAKGNMMIYTFHGEYKRSFKLPPRRMVMWYHNYDKDHLLCYNSFFDYQTQKSEDEHPYYLMSKFDGTLDTLKLNIKNRIGLTVHAEHFKYPGGASTDRTTFMIHPILKNGQETLIADFTLDTLYRFKDKKLIPEMVRTPSTLSTTPPVILNPQIDTDSYFCFEMMPFYYNPSAPFEAYRKLRFISCNKRTGLMEEWEFYDPDYSFTQGKNIGMDKGGLIHKNTAVGWYFADSLVEQYKAGELKGKLKEIASNLSEEDNLVLVLYHFK